MNFSALDWTRIIKDATELVLVCGFCMLTIELTLGEKTGKVKRLKKWLVIGFIMEVLLFFSTLVMTLFDSYINTYQPELWNEKNMMFVIASCIYLFYNTVTMLIPTIFSFVGGMWAYTKEKSIKAFTAVLTGLVASIIYEYIYGIAQLPFLGGDVGDGSKELPPIYLSMIILFICLLVFYLIYKEKMAKSLKSILEIPDGRMDSFVKIPVLSCVIFALLISTLRTFSVYAFTIYWVDLTIYLVVFGCLISAYILLYWSIFRGITLSSEAMKNRAELNVAKHIQASVLPNVFPAFPDREEFSIYAFMDPAKEVGGDFYDFFFVDENHLALVIGDVSGKGVPAAMFMMTARTLIKNLATTKKMPNEILSEANNFLCENNETGMFVTVWMGILEVNRGRLFFANAGHNPPLLKSGDQEYSYLDHKIYKRSIMLGIRENIRYKCNELSLKQGDRLFLYTDGVSEACNKDQELFGEPRLKRILDETNETDPKLLIPFVKEQIDIFVDGFEQFDDITMLALLITALPAVFETDVTKEQTVSVANFVETQLMKHDCNNKISHQVLIAVDEIFSNIVQYSGAKTATIRVLVFEQKIILTFEDDGKAYNPLETKAPDIEAPLEKRGIGGLGIFLVKKIMDSVVYDYRDGKNILIIKKETGEGGDKNVIIS